MQGVFGGSPIGEKHAESAVHEEHVEPVSKGEPVSKE